MWTVLFISHLFIPPFDPDVLRRNSTSEREAGLEKKRPPKAGGWVVKGDDRSLLAQRFDLLITFPLQLHYLGFDVAKVFSFISVCEPQISSNKSMKEFQILLIF